MNYNYDLNLWKKVFGTEKEGFVHTSTMQRLLKNKPVEHVNPKEMPIVLKKEEWKITSCGPKDVSYNEGLIAITCLENQSLCTYDEDFREIAKYRLKTKSVSSQFHKGILYVTQSDLKNASKVNLLTVLDVQKRKIVSEHKTFGTWSKRIVINKKLGELYIANWNSNNISVFDMEKKEKPVFKGLIEAGISPRGMCLTNANKTLCVSCYYSRNIVEIDLTYKRINYISDPYKYPAYSGNLRDIHTWKNKCLITNMGRNSIIIYNPKKRVFEKEIITGRHPTTMCISNNYVYVLCTKESRIYVYDARLNSIGVSEKLRPGSFGMQLVKNSLVTASMESNAIEKWSLPPHKKQPQS